MGSVSSIVSSMDYGRWTVLHNSKLQQEAKTSRWGTWYLWASFERESIAYLKLYLPSFYPLRSKNAKKSGWISVTFSCPLPERRIVHRANDWRFTSNSYKELWVNKSWKNLLMQENFKSICGCIVKAVMKFQHVCSAFKGYFHFYHLIYATCAKYYCISLVDERIETK